MNLNPIQNIRRHHAIEHASLSIILSKNSALHLAGYSDNLGFWVVGDVETDKMMAAVDEAITRCRLEKLLWRYTRIAERILPHPGLSLAALPGWECLALTVFQKTTGPLADDRDSRNPRIDCLTTAWTLFAGQFHN